MRSLSHCSRGPLTPRPDEETGAPRRREPDGGFGAWFRSKECSTVGAHHEITPCWDRQYRESTIFFSPPSKCPTNLFGPVSNRAILKQLHVTSRSSSRNPRRRSATPRLESKNLLAPSLQSPIVPDQSPISNQPPAGTPNLQCPMPVLGYPCLLVSLRTLAQFSQRGEASSNARAAIRVG